MKLEETIRILYDADVEFVVIGGAAMGLQGSRLTANKNRFLGSGKRTLKPHRGPADDHELNVRVIKNSDRFFELHFLLALDLFFRPERCERPRKGCGPAPWGAPQVAMNRVRSMPNSLALAKSLPSGGLVTRSKTVFSYLAS